MQAWVHGAHASRGCVIHNNMTHCTFAVAAVCAMSRAKRYMFCWSAAVDDIEKSTSAAADDIEKSTSAAADDIEKSIYSTHGRTSQVLAVNVTLAGRPPVHPADPDPDTDPDPCL